MRIILTLSVPIFLLSFIVRTSFISEPLYNQAISEAEERTGIPESELRDISRDIRFYLAGGEKREGLDPFTEREILHLKEVRGVLETLRKLQDISFFLIIISCVFLRRRSILKDIARGSLILSLFLLLTFFFALLKFDLFFLILHKICFRTELWIMPEDSLLIKIFPEDFWLKSSLTVGGFLSFLSSLISLVSFLLYRKVARGTAR